MSKFHIFTSDDNHKTSYHILFSQLKKKSQTFFTKFRFFNIFNHETLHHITVMRHYLVQQSSTKSQFQKIRQLVFHENLNFRFSHQVTTVIRYRLI